ncbi:MAG: tetratricopeptide repeat protein [Alphaproteobacteria bacterium]
MRAATRAIGRCGLAAVAVLALSAASVRAPEAQQLIERRLDEARALVFRRDYGTATEQLRQLRDAAPEAERARVENALGWTLFNAGDAKSAQAHLEEAARHAEGQGDTDLSVRIANNLGVVLFSQGDLDGAEAQFKRSATAGASDVPARYLALIAEQRRTNRVNELISNGIFLRRALKFEEAEAAYSQALDLAPGNVRALEFRGYARFRLGRLEEALDDLLEAHAIDPRGLTIVINLLKVHCRAGEMPAARAVAVKSADLLRERIEVVRSDRELREVCGERLGALLPA